MAAREDDVPDAQALHRRLAKARQRARRLRRRLDARTAKLTKARVELAALRSFTLQVFPEQPMPPTLARALAEVRAEHRTFLTAEQLDSLVSCVLETEAAGRPGILIEAGTARGGSAIAMALAKSPERELRVYDVFSMIPPPSAIDGPDVVRRYEVICAGKAAGRADEVYYGYRDDLLGEVTESFARHGVPVGDNRVSLVQGLFQDTITGDEPVALAHVDGDWYESTMTCLERIAPRLVPGGRIVVDDYFMWSGSRTAVDAYFDGRPGFRVEKRAKVHIVRLEDPS